MTYRRATIALALIVGLLLAARYTGPSRSDLAEMHDSLTVRAYRLGYIQGQYDARHQVYDPAVRVFEFRMLSRRAREE